MNDYSITVLQEIVDQDVPMSANPVANNTLSIPFFIGVCVLILVLIFVIHYVCKCFIYQNRATKMSGKKRSFLWNLWNGRRRAYEAEAQKAEQIWNKINE